jgi:hypothetical protein
VFTYVRSWNSHALNPPRTDRGAVAGDMFAHEQLGGVGHKGYTKVTKTIYFNFGIYQYDNHEFNVYMLL